MRVNARNGRPTMTAHILGDMRAWLSRKITDARQGMAETRAQLVNSYLNGMDPVDANERQQDLLNKIKAHEQDEDTLRMLVEFIDVYWVEADRIRATAEKARVGKKAI